MEYDVLGRSGVIVSRLCLGTMMFGQVGNPDHDECVRIAHAAFDAGINFLDTADVYNYGESEQIVGKAIAGRRDQVVVATKCHHPMSDEILNRRGSTRSWIIQACEDSLRRLGTDYIDLYQLHRPDPLTDIDETLGALSDLVHQGKVRLAGCCTFPASEIVEAQLCAERRGHVRLRANQPPYSIFVRGIEREVLDVCRRYGMGVLTWSPLNSGWLTGRIRRGQPRPASPRNSLPMNRPRLADEAAFGKPRQPYPSAAIGDDPATNRKFDAVEELLAVADSAGISLTQLAVAFVLAHPALTSAIIGPRTMEQLTGQLPAADLHLDTATLDAIDAIVPPGADIVLGEAGYLPPAFTETSARRRWR
jgi:aryl-alcohol dehydrogenase-like predicted oxidoreductase